MTASSFKKILNQEKLIYLVVWTIWYIAPLVVIYSHSHLNEGRPFEWGPVLMMWESITVFFVLFLLHNWILAPLLIFKHKTKILGITNVCIEINLLTIKSNVLFSF